MGTQKVIGGHDFITCPLKRRACSYTTNGTLIRCAATDAHHLHGYELNLKVVRYTSNFMSWRGVSSCSATAFESNKTLSSGDVFSEKINMNWDVAPFEPFQPLNLALFSLFGVVGLVALLLYARRKHCPICQKRLLICPNRCYMCTFLAAELPDPVLILALEAKHRRILQGEIRPPKTVLQLFLSALSSMGDFIATYFHRGVQVRPIENAIEVMSVEPDFICEKSRRIVPSSIVDAAKRKRDAIAHVIDDGFAGNGKYSVRVEVKPVLREARPLI